MKETARLAFLASIIFVAVVALALALWKLKLLLAVFFFGLVIAAAMRPGVEALHPLHVPRMIDAKLGAYVRGQLLLVCFVATVLSTAFWIIGLRFWLLVGIFAGLVELIPVVGPLAAGVIAIGVGLTSSWQLALAAGIVVLCVR